MKPCERWAVIALVVVSGLIPASTRAVEEETLAEKVEQLAQPLIDDGTLVGLAIGLIQGDETHVFGFGEVAKGSGQVPDGETIFEIGSITKVYTGLLLADMVERGLVKLDDPVQSLLPDSVKVPKYEDREITLLDLVTHTSALPTLPNNMPFGDPTNPYVDYTVELLEEFLNNHQLRRKPGERLEYSNLGLGLLGHALALRAGKPYEELVQERIGQPLGLSETRITIPEDDEKRFAKGYTGGGEFTPPWDLPTFAGAGGLRSTVQDQIRFLQANLWPERTPLRESLHASHKERFQGEGGRIASAWLILDNGLDRFHNGQTGGYHSFARFRVDGEVAVVILSNSAHFAVDNLGAALLKVLIQESESNQGR